MLKVQLRSCCKYSILFMAFIGCQEKIVEKVDDDDKTPTHRVEVETAEKFNNYFTRYGDGWTGADATYSIPLPDGRVVWIFGDTFLGEVDSTNRSRAPQPLINNSFMVQEGDAFVTLFGKTDPPSAFLVPPDPLEKYWPNHGFTYDDRLYVFLYTWKNNENGGAFGFDFVRTDQAVFDLPSLSLQSIHTVKDDDRVIWGISVMKEGPYLYIYGSEDRPFESKRLHLARVPLANLEADWSYWTQNGWSTEEDSYPLLEGISNQFSVFKHQHNYYLIVQGDSFSEKIYRYKATKPQGPFTDPLVLYETPDHGGETWTYNACAHPEFMQEDSSLLISYNVNSMNFSELFENADYYRPYFVWVRNWE